MCTVSYVPTSDGYVFTSNRDEHISRAATEVQSKSTKTSMLYYPEDPVGKGSWISMTGDGRLACLLNGGLTMHIRKPPYRKSRGEILLSCFNYSDFETFVQEVNINNIEPFTLLLISADGIIIELIWDHKKHITYLDQSEVHLWSSSTLYNTDLSNQKEIHFNKNLLPSIEVSPQSIIRLHDQMRYENLIIAPTSPFLCTTSITQVLKSETDINMRFKSMVYDMDINQVISFG